MKSGVIFLCLLFICVAAFGVPKDSIAIKEVERLERSRFNAQVQKDYGFLEKVFATDLVYIHSNGAINTKDEYLQSIKDGKSVYDKIDIDELKLRSYCKGHAVVINGKITMVQPPIDGKPHISHLRYTVLYVKKKEGWQLVTWQSLKLQ